MLMDHVKESPVTSEQINSWTRHDPMLSAVLQATEMSCDLLLSANSNYWYWRVVSCGAAAYVVVPRQR